MKKIFIFLLALGLTACATATPDTSGAGQAIEAYLQAKAAADTTQITTLVCPAFERAALTEATAFKSMNAQLENVACTVGDKTDDGVAVTCTGKITTTYQGEAREWPVDNQTYNATLNDGAWLMCGYK